MTTIAFELPDSSFSALRKAPEEFTRELRLAAAVKWYELAMMSQEKAASIAGVTRAVAELNGDAGHSDQV